MTPKGHSVIRGRRDLLYDPKGHVDHCGWFDVVYDPKRSRGYWKSPWIYFMTPKINLAFDFDIVQKVKHLTLQLTPIVQATL